MLLLATLRFPEPTQVMVKKSELLQIQRKLTIILCIFHKGRNYGEFGEPLVVPILSEILRFSFENGTK